jgi:DNA primase
MHPERREALAVSRNDMIELIGEYLPFLSVSPTEVRALCPFHDDEIGSFTIDRQAQTFACRSDGCPAHGDLIDFVALYECVSRAEATDMLLERIGYR